MTPCRSAIKTNSQVLTTIFWPDSAVLVVQEGPLVGWTEFRTNLPLFLTRENKQQ